ncbi:glycosyltransferase family 2 protein [Pedobacter yulinensis]|uniref:Glycosyltransferase family 2 protein n=1 Tax=Pedobacter yulinensis TaxID=2126353 RepID=A0A2T3HQN5_9SPHI|nr:glycosyltransferase family 2 protein [Pedobacter yulinensis]PST84762.1 glycosyltransferase family 2 protein [Pedobacter yulinensis]
MVFIIIPVFNRLEFTTKCLDSLQMQKYVNYRTIVVDHGSTDGTASYITEKYPDVTILTGDESMWWTAATNVGIKYALEQNATFVLTLNNDLTVDETYIGSLMNFAKDHQNAIVGSVSVDIDNPDRIVFAGTRWNRRSAKYRSAVSLELSSGKLKELYNEIETDMLPGRGTLIPTDVFSKIGLYDVDSFPHYAADEDFSLRAERAGYELFVSPASLVKSRVEHTGLGSQKKVTLNYIIRSFTSIKSPRNLRIRWRWAKRHTPAPPIYFAFDFARILKSMIIK